MAEIEMTLTSPLYTTSRTENLLNIQSVSLSFGTKKVLENVNFKIDKLVRIFDSKTPNSVSEPVKTGQIVAFLGPSGVGKTMLMRIIAGLQPPTSGQVLIGHDHKPVSPGLVGMVSQNSTLYRNRTVLGNLVIAAKQKHESAPVVVAMSMLSKFGLDSVASLYPSQLSGGQRQRIAIAQQLLCSEHFLLLDEPTSGLDPVAKKKVCTLVSSVANQDGLNTIGIVTHDVRSALSMADTVVLLGRDWKDGKVISGAHVIATYDMIERGLMWHPDVDQMPKFAETEREVLAKFETL